MSAATIGLKVRWSDSAVPLFDDPYERNERRGEYAVRPDGKGFIFIKEGLHALTVRLVVGWQTMRETSSAR